MADPDGTLLVVSRIWPTRQRPSLGTYVGDRVRGISNVRVVKPRSQHAPAPLLYALLLVDALRVRGRLQGVEAHMAFPTGLVGLAVARIRRAPLVIYSHGGDVRGWRRKPMPIRWLTRYALARADRVVANSDETATTIREMGLDPIVVPPGVDLTRFSPSPRPSIRRVLYMGGRNPRKGYEVAIKLADTLVGPWLREVPPSDIPALVAEHDVVLIPSVAEPFGLAAVEAIASGRWVVASDVGGLREIVVDGVNGTLVRDGDFAAALARVPDYDPAEIARTVERYSLTEWHGRMTAVWAGLAGT